MMTAVTTMMILMTIMTTIMMPMTMTGAHIASLLPRKLTSRRPTQSNNSATPGQRHHHDDHDDDHDNHDDDHDDHNDYDKPVQYDLESGIGILITFRK